MIAVECVALTFAFEVVHNQNVKPLSVFHLLNGGVDALLVKSWNVDVGELAGFQPLLSLHDTVLLILGVIAGCQPLILNTGQMGEDSGCEKPCVQLAVQVQNGVILLEQVNRTVEEHHALTLLLLRPEDKQLSPLNGGVVVQSRELEGDTSISAALPIFNLLPALIYNLRIRGNIVGSRKLHHHIIQKLVDALLNVVAGLLEAQLLALSQLLESITPKGCVFYGLCQELIPLDRVANQRIRVVHDGVELLRRNLTGQMTGRFVSLQLLNDDVRVNLRDILPC